MNTVVNDEPPWIDWKMPLVSGGVHVISGEWCPFSDPPRPDYMCTPPGTCKSKYKESTSSSDGNSRRLITASIYLSSYDRLKEQEHHHEYDTHRKIMPTQILHTEKSYAQK